MKSTGEILHARKMEDGIIVLVHSLYVCPMLDQKCHCRNLGIEGESGGRRGYREREERRGEREREFGEGSERKEIV